MRSFFIILSIVVVYCAASPVARQKRDSPFLDGFADLADDIASQIDEGIQDFAQIGQTVVYDVNQLIHQGITDLNNLQPTQPATQATTQATTQGTTQGTTTATTTVPK